jgi:putative transcriptional regulator
MSVITYTNTTEEVMAELGRRVRDFRLQQNLTVAEVALKAGLSVSAISNIENGRNPRLESIVRALRVLGRLESLDAFLPPPLVSPIQLAQLKGRPRRRARKRRDA